MSAAETQIRLAYLDRDHLFEIGVDEISFEENGVEYRPFPDARFYVIIDSAKGERLTAFLERQTGSHSRADWSRRKPNFIQEFGGASWDRLSLL